MQDIKCSNPKNLSKMMVGAIAIATVATTLFTPVTVSASSSARQNNILITANQQHNWASHAPRYDFETTFPIDHWGRPTTSNVAPQHTQNIRRDRHSAALPPSHGSQTGFYSGEFPTNQANPFAPRYNNNPAASRAVGIDESVFAVRLGEAGVNVRADNSHSDGFLASTSTAQSGGGNIGNNAPHGGVAGDAAPPWSNPSSQSGVTITHTPMPGAGVGSSQSGNQSGSQSQSGRVTTVTPFADGTIGRITIPALGNRVASVRSGVTLSILNNYVGHFSYTSQWDGNIALASHNRGQGSFFAGIWTLQHGDRIIYETTMGVRTFEIVSITQISENDLGNLNHSLENILTLVTCVYSQPSLRWSVRAREVV